MSKQAIPGATRANAFLVDPSDVVIVGLDTKDGIEHPLYDPRIHLPLDEGLVLDLMELGQLQEVLVRKNGDAFEVVDGRQRIRAMREANKRLAAKGMETMKARVAVRRPLDRRSVEADALGVMISANENRQDDDVVAKAAKAERLLALGKEKAEVARRFGIVLPSLENLLALNDLSDTVRAAIQAKQIGFIAAIKLNDLSHKDQDETLAAILASGQTTIAELERMRRARKKKKNGKATAEETEPRAKRPALKVIRKVSQDEAFMSGLSPDAKALLAWFLGDEKAAKRIKGLSAALREE